MKELGGLLRQIFAEIWIYDMNQKQPEPTKIALDELQSKYPLLDFLVKNGSKDNIA